MLVENINPFSQFCSELGSWAVNENISLSSVTKLLHILRHKTSNVDLSILPKDVRSLVRTPVSIQTNNDIRLYCHEARGKYVYFGIEKSINQLFDKFKISIHNNMNIELAMNIDGLPLTKTTGEAFSPILGLVKSLSFFKSEVFVLLFFVAFRNLLELLADFIRESAYLTNYGLKYGAFNILFKVKM